MAVTRDDFKQLQTPLIVAVVLVAVGAGTCSPACTSGLNACACKT